MLHDAEAINPRKLRRDIDALRRAIAGEPDGFGTSLTDVPHYRRALAEIEIDGLTLEALAERSGHDAPVGRLVAARLRLRIAELMLEVAGPRAVPDQASIGHNQHVALFPTADAAGEYLAAARAEAATAREAYALLIDAIFKRPD